MKKIIYSSTILATLFLSSFTMTSVASQEDLAITLPSIEILTERFNKAGLQHFAEKTDLIENLAGTEKYPLGVALALELALYDYSENMKNPRVTATMNLRKYEILDLILKDYPKELAELKKTY